MCIFSPSFNLKIIYYYYFNQPWTDLLKMAFKDVSSVYIYMCIYLFLFYFIYTDYFYLFEEIENGNDVEMTHTWFTLTYIPQVKVHNSHCVSFSFFCDSITIVICWSVLQCRFYAFMRFIIFNALLANNTLLCPLHIFICITEQIRWTCVFSFILKYYFIIK